MQIDPIKLMEALHAQGDKRAETCKKADPITFQINACASLILYGLATAIGEAIVATAKETPPREPHEVIRQPSATHVSDTPRGYGGEGFGKGMFPDKPTPDALAAVAVLAGELEIATEADDGKEP